MGNTILYFFEIIETYWNVNSIDIAYKIAQRLGNNRNILECKLHERAYPYHDRS